MNSNQTQDLSPRLCASKIFEVSGTKLDPEIASCLWPRIERHKWLRSESLNRDVGLKTACVDFLENMRKSGRHCLSSSGEDTLRLLEAERIGMEKWNTISDSQPPKQIVERKIVLPISQLDLSAKHGVVPPRAIIFFGLPGTDKTHFARAIAGIIE